jgi:hypothetical protein
VEILTALSAHVDTLGNQAKEKIEQRLKEFEADLLEKFATDQAADVNAFHDPDFLAATLDAQKAYSRSGDADLKKALTDLVAQRSKVVDRNRLSLTLNDAIQKVGYIPESDLNAMSLMFLFQNAQNNGIYDIEGLARNLDETAIPLLNDISTSQSAFDYLSAHGCVMNVAGGFTRSSAMEVLSAKYTSIISKGSTEANLREKFDDYDMLKQRGLIIPSPYDSGLEIFSISGPQLNRIFAENALFGDYLSPYDEVSMANMPSTEEFISIMTPKIPQIRKLMSVYDEPTIRNSRLSSIGIALAHANLAKGPFKDVDLSIWIKP